MKKQNKSNRLFSRGNRAYREWKARRDIAFRAIPLEVDLQNREIYLGQELKSKLDFELHTSDVDGLISRFVDPADSITVKQGLADAEHGQEQPISFNFIHPRTAERFRFEYRYEIVYVRYASTRLNGVLVNVRDPEIKKRKT